VPPDYPLLVTPGLWSIHVPPVAEGLVRLYRGEHPTADGPHFVEKESTNLIRGGWFTNDFDYALFFRRAHGAGAHILYVDVPQSVAKKRAIANFPKLMSSRVFVRLSKVLNDRQLGESSLSRGAGAEAAGRTFLFFPEIRQIVWRDYSSYFDWALGERQRARAVKFSVKSVR
jgi:hypothetical protein